MGFQGGGWFAHIRQVELASWASHIGMVAQETFFAPRLNLAWKTSGRITRRPDCWRVRRNDLGPT